MHTPELDFVTAFNAIEAVWWFACGVLMWRFSHRYAVHQTLSRRTACALLIFGASDVLEVFTGAWWRPWWLAVLKIACGISITVGMWILWRRRAFSAR
ncbi:MAG TPA: hypothetical protein VFG20_01535 [Planctomycetaceae bacterium]|nr:hypothetical protein [Planctomycetaceae bacterium]